MKKPKRQKKSTFRSKTVLLAITGSIAAYKACEIIRNLKVEGINVICLLTKNALEFITPLTLKSLSENQVFCDQFGEHKFKEPLHTALADQANLILVAPASADIIARLATGMADDLVTSVILSSPAKVLIAPAMNDHMYQHPLTQENIAKLKKIGYEFIEPIKGPLICGREGIGHLASEKDIVFRVKSLLHA